jgi:hypothetical protein
MFPARGHDSGGGGDALPSLSALLLRALLDALSDRPRPPPPPPQFSGPSPWTAPTLPSFEEAALLPADPSPLVSAAAALLRGIAASTEAGAGEASADDLMWRELAFQLRRSNEQIAESITRRAVADREQEQQRALVSLLTLLLDQLRDPSEAAAAPDATGSRGGLTEPPQQVPRQRLAYSFGAASATAPAVERGASLTQVKSGEDESRATGAPTRSEAALLARLGSTRRTCVGAYVDCLHLAVGADERGSAVAAVTKWPPHPEPAVPRVPRGGIYEHFPERLHAMMLEMEAEGCSGVASFLPHGRAILVLHRDRFVQTALPRYFRHDNWTSFMRQLALYGFRRIPSGIDCGGFYHELFLKTRPDLCLHMRRVGVRRDGEGDGRKRSSATGLEARVTPPPNFYSMDPAF